jgi:hypothetical protein
LKFKPWNIYNTNQTCKDFIRASEIVSELLFKHCSCYNDTRGVTLVTMRSWVQVLEHNLLQKCRERRHRTPKFGQTLHKRELHAPGCPFTDSISSLHINKSFHEYLNDCGSALLSLLQTTIVATGRKSLWSRASSSSLLKHCYSGISVATGWSRPLLLCLIVATGMLTSFAHHYLSPQ